MANSISGFELLAGKNLYGVTPPADTVNLLSYSGGPGSVLGIGNTNIRLQNSTIRRKDIYADGEIDYEKEIVNNPHNTSVLKNQFFVSRKTPTYLYNPDFTYDRISSTPGLSFSFFQYAKSIVGEEPLNSNLFGEGSTDELLLRKDIPAPTTDFNNSSYTFGRNQLLERKSLGVDKFTSYASVTIKADGTGEKLPGITDFRQEIEESTFTGNNQDLAFTDYSLFNREKTYLDSATTYKGNWKDGKRILDPNEWISPEQQEVGVTGEDIVDFNFTIISNDIKDPYSDVPFPGGRGNLLIDFRAYIEDWSDSVKADWTPIKYMGRAENFYKYNGWSRDASVSFIVPALSRGDMILNYNKLNALAWTVAPSYSPGSDTIPGVMRGSIVKFTMGNYFRGMPCVIKDVSFSEVKDMGWDINRYNDNRFGTPGEIIKPSDEGTGELNDLFTGQLPKGIKVQVNFTPIHNFVPQFGEPFIGDYSGEFSGVDNVYTAKFAEFI